MADIDFWNWLAVCW